MTKYAQNLIGDWETEQFEPLRQVAQAQYQTNWNKLTNDFNNLNEQLAQNFKNARMQHNNAIVDSSRDAYSRMYNAEQNLANRGLTGSGLLNTYNAINTEQTGQTNNALMEDLMNANKANMEGRIAGLDTYANNVANLSGKLADELAGITDAEGDNYRKYRDLIGSLSESASGRASANASANAERELEKEEQEFYRRLGILKTLNDDELDEYQKRIILINEYDLDLDDTNSALGTMDYLKVNDKLDKRMKKDAKFYGTIDTKEVKKLEDELKNYTYTDLWELMNK